jgi:antitoxin YefM
MIDMLAINATTVRNEWSTVVDNVVRKKPQFITRTRDQLLLADITFLETILSTYEFTATSYEEEDGSITLSLNELDLAENAETEALAKKNLAEAIMEYAKDFYNEFEYWNSAQNRKAHVPYVFKALIQQNIHTLEELISCQAGKN